MDNSLIKRQAAIKVASGYCHPANIAKELAKLPSAEPKRKTGKWKKAYLDHEAFGERPKILYCSVCNQCIAYPTNFCPSCGADMRGTWNETN